MDTSTTSRSHRRWYTEERSRLLARYYFLKGDSLQVADVSDQDPVYDLLVSGDVGRGTFTIGVVTNGFMELPEHEVATSGEPFHSSLLFPQPPFQVPNGLDGSIPTLFAIFDVVEDRGAVAMLTDRPSPNAKYSIESPALVSSPESETPLAINQLAASERAMLFTPMEAIPAGDLCRLTLRVQSLLVSPSSSLSTRPTIETHSLTTAIRRRIATLTIQDHGRGAE